MSEPLKKHTITEGKDSWHAALCWPTEKIALNVTGKGQRKLIKAGWLVKGMDRREADAAGSILAFASAVDATVMGGIEIFESGKSPKFDLFPPQSLKALFRYLISEVPGLPTPHFGTERGHPLAWWPDQKVSFEKGDGEEFFDYQVIGFPVGVGQAAGKLIATIDESKFHKILTIAEESAEASTSQAETRLLQAMLDVGIQNPDRNHEFFYEDGRVATIPDMTWEDIKLVVELDGWWVHKGKHLDFGVRAAVAGDDERGKKVVSKAQDSSVRDARKRRRLGEMGWAVYIVHDLEVTTLEDALIVARQIKTIIEQRRQLMESSGE